MNGTIPKQNRHGSCPLQTERYSEERIAQFNSEHDKRLGWSQDLPTLYTNVDRYPETYHGKASEVWNKP